MPYPEKGEEKSHYISRCIPYIIKEKGVEQDQAAAICYSLWSKNEGVDIIVDKYLNEADGEGIADYKGWTIDTYNNPTGKKKKPFKKKKRMFQQKDVKSIIDDHTWIG